MFYVYVLQSLKSKHWHTGYTHDLRKRFSQHNANEFGWTKNHGPFRMIYYGACLHEEDAKDREVYLKTGMGERYLKNRLKRFLSLTG
ncbi:MAG: hypothetical protein A3A44_00020 [Candidatus Sungbacteria bacterium RIFCSPLOWO2_01_FULL_60_25]|uniref:GIY-YIG domain-containing protein n=1 Tax=Candidatus Sungbacteria bacterium RIFCSPLOWO2_01_FULL_60_25 TaxID=1802281 RepID=A0A1G2LBC3_9BACT|nr:MAG: hypothetical protein A3A44_00020 [Candidatus Sungbacteria bacterium RIFCSPLOWO2_01_FULL_60_25]